MHCMRDMSLLSFFYHMRCPQVIDIRILIRIYFLRYCAQGNMLGDVTLYLFVLF